MSTADLRTFFTNKPYEKVSVRDLFPTLAFSNVACPDMSVHGNFFGKDINHEDLEEAARNLELFQDRFADSILANGYLEERAFYNTPAFERNLNGEIEYRNIHLGTDFWVNAHTSVHTPFGGEVIISHNNDYHKDYGPTLVLKHQLDDLLFYTLYGHLSRDSLRMSPKGRVLQAGEELGYIGSEEENGHWLPHLHFQLITDLLGETENYNGVAFPSEIEKWKNLCPNPDLVFTEHLPSAEEYPLRYHSR